MYRLAQTGIKETVVDLQYPLASTEECEVYNGCAWDGDFAYVDNRPYNYVENTDIVAFFASGGETFPKKIIRVYSPSHGKTVDAIVLDTCGDDDCNGCCTENADTGGGYLVDMEENTVVRHFGALEEAEGLVCWKILDDEEYDAGGYCNWGECNGDAQGGWDCNLNEYECKTTCGGGNWCDIQLLELFPHLALNLFRLLPVLFVPHRIL